MINKHKFTYITFALLLCCSLMLPDFSYAAEDKISQAEKAKDTTASNIKSLNARLDQLEQSKSSLKSYMTNLNTQLAELSNTISNLESHQQEKESEIALIKKELSAARTQEKNQYESMKKRIKYIYENGELDFLSILFGAEDIADMLNKLEFVTQISKYDRNMLIEYQKIRDTVASVQASLEAEKTELVKLKKQTEEQQQAVSVMLSAASDELSGFDTDIASAQDQISDYEKQLMAQEQALDNAKQEQAAAQEKEAANKAKQEADAKAAANKDNTSASTSNTNSSQDEGTKTPTAPDNGSHSDLELLAAIIECESGGESMDGKIAVGNVVMNRVKSGAYPNTVLGVIYQNGQFSPVASGRFAIVLARGASTSCTSAANRVLSGENNIGSLLHFRRVKDGDEGVIIGNHYFY